MSDLVERLRCLGDDLNKGYKDRRRKTCAELREAADEIERLHKAMQEMRDRYSEKCARVEALEGLLNDPVRLREHIQMMLDIEALEATEQEKP